MSQSLDLKAEITAMRDHALHPHDLGLLFSMVEGMPDFFVRAFKDTSDWRTIDHLFDKLLEYCSENEITIIS